MENLANQVSPRVSTLRMVPKKVTNECFFEIAAGLQKVVEYCSVAYCPHCDCPTEYVYTSVGKTCKLCGRVDVMRMMMDGTLGDADRVLMRTIIFQCSVKPVYPITEDGCGAYENGSLVQLFGSYYPAGQMWAWLFQNGYLDRSNRQSLVV